MNIVEYAERNFGDFVKSEAFAKKSVEERASWLFAAETAINALRVQIGFTTLQPLIHVRLPERELQSLVLEARERRLTWARSTLRTNPYRPSPT